MWGRCSRLFLLTLAALVFSSALLYSGASAGFCPPNMVGYWKFDESAGMTAEDSARENDGDLGFYTGDWSPADDWVPGMAGNALYFDGEYSTGQGYHVDMPNGGRLDIGTNDFTVALWFRRNGNIGDTTQTLFSSLGDYEGQDKVIWIFLMDDDVNKIRVNVADNYGGEPMSSIYSASVVDDTNWHHLAVTFDRDGLGRIYLDGQLDGSADISSQAGTMERDGWTHIGAYGSGLPPTWAFFNGTIDEVAVYDTAMTLEEVEDVRQTGLEGKGLCEGCINDDQIIMKTFSPSNAHGALWDDADYEYKICYDNVFEELYSKGTPHDCTGSNRVAGLFDTTNAHAEEPGLTNYATDVCFGDLFCVMRDIACDDGFEPVISLFADTNSHITDPKYVPDGAVGLWRFDEQSGADMAPDEIRGNDGSLTNMDPATDWVLGKTGNALDFDGVNDYVSVPDDGALDLRRAITVEAWFKADTFTNTYMPLVWKGDGTGQDGRTYTVWLVDDGSMLLTSADSTDQEYVTVPAGTIGLGNWYHFVGVIDRNTGTNGLRAYINGVEVITGDVRTTDTVSSDLDLMIGYTTGAEVTGFVSPFDGIIDEVAVYSTVLSEEDIQHRYNQGMYEKKICCQGEGIDPTVTIDYASTLVYPHKFGPSEFGYNYPVTYTATATDNSGTGISEVRIYIDGALARTCAFSPCSLTIPAGYGAGQTVDFYAEADDNDLASLTGVSAPGSFTVCKLESASIDDSTCADPVNGCVPGDSVDVTAVFSGTTCLDDPAPLFAQIDASSGDGCDVEAAVGAGDMVGISADIDKCMSHVAGYWKFDESSGSTADDYMGNNDGELYILDPLDPLNTEWEDWVPGRAGNALHFAGEQGLGSGYTVELPYDGLDMGTKDFTISTWIRRAGGFDEGQYIFIKAGAAGDLYDCDFTP